MSKFNSLSIEKDFLACHSKRSAVLVELQNLKKSLEGLPKDKPSLRAFERIEARVESERDLMESASNQCLPTFVKLVEILLMILVLMIIVTLKPTLLVRLKFLGKVIMIF